MRTSPRAIWQLRRRGGVRSTDRPGTKERPAPGESSSSVARCCRARVASGAARAHRERRPPEPHLRGTPWSDPPHPGGPPSPPPPPPPRPGGKEVAAAGGPPLGTQGMVGLTLDVLHAHEPC